MRPAILLALASFAAAIPVDNSADVPSNHRTTPRKQIKNERLSGNWAGVIINKPSGTFQAISATVTVPTPSSTGGSQQQAGSAWVGIDGDTCESAILQTGIDWYANPTSFDVWYEWYPDVAYTFSGFKIQPGHKVVLQVVATSKTAGYALVHNLNTGQEVKHTFSGQPALCQQDAEWIVEDFQEGTGEVPFAAFSPVEFDGSVAHASGGVAYYSSQGQLIDIVSSSGQRETQSSQQGSTTVLVKYV